MNKIISSTLSTTLLALACAGLLSTTAKAADLPPEKPVGVGGMSDAVGVVDLAPHNLAGTPGDYEVHTQLVTLAPGGGIQNHPHAGRPGIARVTKGTLIEYRGSSSRTLQVGDSWLEAADTVHWFRNPSATETAELWVVDLVPKKK